MKRLIVEYQIELIAIVIGTLVLFLFSGCGETRAALDVAKHHSGSGGNISGTINWLITVSIIGIGASVAAAIFLPVKAIASASIGGFAAILGLALFVSAIRPYLPWFALAIGIAALGGGIWYFRKWALAAHAAVAFGTEVADPTSGSTLEQIKIEHAAEQAKTGVKKIIDRILKGST